MWKAIKPSAECPVLRLCCQTGCASALGRVVATCAALRCVALPAHQSLMFPHKEPGTRPHPTHTGEPGFLLHWQPPTMTVWLRASFSASPAALILRAPSCSTSSQSSCQTELPTLTRACCGEELYKRGGRCVCARARACACVCVPVWCSGSGAPLLSPLSSRLQKGFEEKCVRPDRHGGWSLRRALHLKDGGRVDEKVWGAALPSYRCSEEPTGFGLNLASLGWVAFRGKTPSCLTGLVEPANLNCKPNTHQAAAAAHFPSFYSCALRSVRAARLRRLRRQLLPSTLTLTLTHSERERPDGRQTTAQPTPPELG